ncbi:MAG: type II/IV secretion system protein [Phycisphaerales bacterium]|nr:type II/IV secretion system protein [Phycisphaerales bacterium]
MIDVGDFIQQALAEAGYLDDDRLAQAKAKAADEGIEPHEAAVALGFVKAHELAIVKAGVHEVPYLNLAHYEISFTNTTLVPRSVAEKFTLFPLFDIDGVLTVGMDEPLNLNALDQVRQHARRDVEVVLCEPEQLRALISRAYRLSASSEHDSLGADDQADAMIDDDSQPVVAAMNQLVADAIEEGASDIHLSPDEHDLHLRFRIDGALQIRQGPSLAMHNALVQRLKVMARLDLTQTRRPQDGKLRFPFRGRDYDIRLSTIPTVYGENVVMRILRPHAAIVDFAELGLAPLQIELFEEWISQPYGMILVTGPTGSGKTTTLYTALDRLNSPQRNIMTVEDPVEIRLPMVRQIQVNPEINLTFANALRSILRQDPDVVLVGEIRDNETATVAMQASLTGHLVLSTLHTNDAGGAVTRLQDLGVPPYMVNSSLLGVAAQRLVRRVCEHCIQPHVADEVTRRRFGLTEEDRNFIHGHGCSRCLQTGYHGRVGIYELLPMTPDIKHAIESDHGTEAVRRAAVDAGFRPMWMDGVDKARLGLTTLEEIAKVVSVTQQSASSDETSDRMNLKRSA